MVDLLDLQRAMRLQRLRQVREQNRLIAVERRSSYSSSMRQEKQKKGRKLIARVTEETASCRKRISNAYKDALMESGNSHRDAHESAAKLVKKMEADREHNLSKRLIVASRSHHAREEIANCRRIHTKEEKQKKMKVLDTKIEFSKEERNGARWISDSYFAKRGAESMWKSQGKEFHNTTFQTHTYGFSPHLHKRGPFIVHAIITRHSEFESEANRNTAQNSSFSIGHDSYGEIAGTDQVFNEQGHSNGLVCKDSNIAAKKLFKAVLSQLLSNSTAVKRAGEARQITLTKQLTRTFEDDLALLYNLDRQGERATRIRNLDTAPCT